jgi:hypothetical protein
MELCSCPSNVPFRDSNIKKQGHQPVENRETLTVSRETLTVRLRDVDTALLLEEVCSPHFSATKTALILEGIQRQLSLVTDTTRTDMCSDDQARQIQE